VRVELRFYAELKDLLAPGHESGELARTFDVPGSVKDVIESCGVPHTEVDLILVNGESVDFGHRLADGDRISVYPVFEAFDISPALRVRPSPLRDIRFVLDGHLGRLSGYLRLLGFDVLYDNTWSDHELAAVSSAEQRILLTRDVGLLKHGSVTHGYLVRAVDPREQLVEVVRRFHLSGQLAPFTRCMPCNGLLEPVEKAEVVGRLQPGTGDRFDEYWICTDCERLYWRGSHHERLERIVEEARRVEA
jgi:uncharacterized protein with PIN domain